MMQMKHLVAGLALLGTVVAGLAGGASRAVRADTAGPTLTFSLTQLNPLGVEALGTSFTPGGAVHLDLMAAFWPAPPSADPQVTPVPAPSPSPDDLGPPQVLASLDTWAARTTYVRNGHGVVFTRVGGYFDVTLVSPSPTCGEFLYWVVATDRTTGRSVTTGQSGAQVPCS